MKKSLLIFLLALSLLVLAACAQGGGGDEKCKVTLISTEGVSVIGDNPMYVEKGGTAVFTVQLGSTMAFRSASAGVYDSEAGTLTIENVKRDMRVEIIAEDLGYDTSAEYDYRLVGGELDTSSISAGNVRVGTAVTVYAGDTNRVFVGWTVGGKLGVGDLVSSDREFSFDLTPDMAINGMCYIFANYKNSNVMVYDPNGGQINWQSTNLSHSDYYVAREVDGKAEITLSTSYFEVTGSSHTFWNDGSFTREGYVLKEFNTRPDGSGESYGFGYVYALTDGATLYCIWSEDTPHTDFTYENIRLPMPSSTDSTRAPHWTENGIVITSYTGDDTTVTIPETIEGKRVTAIASGAFTNKKVETLVLSRFILKIEDGAFVGCSSLSTLYYPDSVYYISNGVFDKATYSGFHHLYVNATMAPRYAASAEGAFAIKLMRIMANPDKPRVIVIAGSSTYLGLSTEYFEKLMDGEVTAVNFGTTRTTHCYVYLEAMGAFTDEDDYILYAPENSIYTMGEPYLYWKSLRDFECMYNLYRHIDIANYENVFGAFAEFNAGTSKDVVYDKMNGRYTISAKVYEQIVNDKTTDHNGEYINSKMAGYCNDVNYSDFYQITLNNRVNSRYEGKLDSSLGGVDWRTSEAWCDLNDPKFVRNMNAAITSAQSSGAKVYFAFCPMDASKVIPEAQADSAAWFDAFEKLIEDTYVFDGVLGEVENYVYDHKYFFNNAFHPNDYGKVYRTYALYKDLCGVMGKEVKYGVLDVGEVPGCLFEKGAVDSPVTKVDYLTK
ncbi:MAG: leucine-rich repeat protein [Clostridia bacterium]|nr:leucine-rich repeat protein [Clostridia bacterium]